MSWNLWWSVQDPHCPGVCILWSVHNVSYPETRFISGGCQEATSFLPVDPSPFTPKYILKQYCPYYIRRNIFPWNTFSRSKYPNISSNYIVPFTFGDIFLQTILSLEILFQAILSHQIYDISSNNIVPFIFGKKLSLEIYFQTILSLLHSEKYFFKQ